MNAKIPKKIQDLIPTSNTMRTIPPSIEVTSISETMVNFGAPLDPEQLLRIETVHRGFLYQHLYAVACLLTCGRQAGGVVIVERDEDVEFVMPGWRHYVQVKTRSRPLRFEDIGKALARFEQFREEHAAGKRIGVPIFNVVANVDPGPELASRIEAPDWPTDINIISPSRSAKGPLPAAWPNIDAAIQWCSNLAASIPFGTLSPETLMWKLAATVHHAASGARDHKFSADELPELLEQLLVQLQDFPDPPTNYRPQLNEPLLVTDSPVRILTGFSGAGKTAWASQAALHCPKLVVYYDVGDMPTASLADGLARELAARFAGGRRHGLSGTIFAGTAGVGVLRACAAELDRQGLQITIVLDNTHRISADTIRMVVEAAPKLRFLLIAQPWADQAVIEALFGISAEHLAGWSNDTIAAEFNDSKCPVSIETAELISRMTGGLPLYVRSAVQLALSGYAGEAATMCQAIESRAHTEDIAQEIILEETFARLNDQARSAAALLSFADIKLTNSEAIEFLTVVAESPAQAAQSLRELRRASIVIGYQGYAIGLHDALRPLAMREAKKFAPAKAVQALRQLHAILVASLKSERNIPRLNAVLRLLPQIGETETLVDLATAEMIHEHGDQRTLRSELEKAAQDQEKCASDRYWAHDALAFWESRDGGRPSDKRLSAMRMIIEEGKLGQREQLGLCFKALVAAGADGDRLAVDRLFFEGERLAQGHVLFSRLLRYNCAVALHRVGAHEEVLIALESLIQEYYGAIGLREADVFMKGSQELYDLLPEPIDRDNLKRLGDSLAAWAATRAALGQPPMLRRIHAAKFYTLAQAGRSAALAAQNAVDDFLVIMADPIGARQTMEQHVLPTVKEFCLTDMILPVRSHYAIVLAWCGEVAEARRELHALSAYGGSSEQKAMLEERSKAVEDIAVGRVQLRRQTPPPGALRSIQGASAFLARKVGRNKPCPCGSGLKFKRCHGGQTSG